MGMLLARLRPQSSPESTVVPEEHANFHSTIITADPGTSTWTKLPPELQLAILGQLPVSQRFRARRVCRSCRELLDGNRRPWLDVQRLTLSSRHPGLIKTALDLYWMTIPHRYRSHWTKQMQRHFVPPLKFLASRCPLTSLELVDVSFQLTEALLPAAIASHLKLRSFAASSWDLTGCQDQERLSRNLGWFLLCQPQLESLVLGPFPDTFQGFLLSSLYATRQLQQLRTLVLYGPSVVEVMAMSASVLAGLDCLAAYVNLGSKWQADTERALQNCMRHLAPKLRRGAMERQYSGPRYFYRLMWWSKEGFDVKKAFANKALHSRNFLTA